MLWLNWFITDKVSDTSKMSQEMRSTRAALFGKTDVLWSFPIFMEKRLWWSQFWKIVSPHVCNCTKKDAITGVSLLIDFVNAIFWFISLKHPSEHAWQSRSSYKEDLHENTCAPVFFFLIKLHTIKPATLLKRDFITDVLLWILRNY